MMRAPSLWVARIDLCEAPGKRPTKDKTSPAAQLRLRQANINSARRRIRLDRHLCGRRLVFVKRRAGWRRRGLAGVHLRIPDQRGRKENRADQFLRADGVFRPGINIGSPGRTSRCPGARFGCEHPYPMQMTVPPLVLMYVAASAVPPIEIRIAIAQTAPFILFPFIPSSANHLHEKCARHHP